MGQWGPESFDVGQSGIFAFPFLGFFIDLSNLPPVPKSEASISEELGR